MVAQVTVKDNSVQVSKAIADIVRKFPQVTKKALAQVSAFQISNIRNRTQKKGLDVNERPFKPYSIKYKRAKIKESGVVDLTDTGQMFSSLTSKISPSKGVLFFRNQNANRKAFYHDEVGAGKSKVVRSFFGISDREEDKIVKLFENILEKEIKF